MKDKYINGQLKLIDNKIEEITSKSNRYDTLTSLSSIFFGVCGFFLLFGAPLLSIPCGVLTIANTYGNHRNKRVKEKAIEILNAEKKHLQKLKTTDPQSTPALDKKREDKIDSLKQKKAALDSESKGSKTANIISNVITTAGAVAGLIVPPLSIISAVGLVGSIISGWKDTKNKRRCNINDCRINKLQHDLNVIKINKKNIQQNNQQSTQQNNNNTKQNVNTRQNTSNSQSQQQTQQQQVPPLPKRQTQQQQVPPLPKRQTQQQQVPPLPKRQNNEDVSNYIDILEDEANNLETSIVKVKKR